MKELFPDWRAKNVTVCLHERQGGFAFNLDSVQGLVGKCESEGVTILSGLSRVTGFVSPSGRDVTAVETSEGTIEVEHVVVAPGPWAKHFWSLLGLPMTLDVRTPTGDVVPDQAMWTYWNLQEGESRSTRRCSRFPTAACPPSCTSTRTRRCARTTASSSRTTSGASTSSRTGTACRAAPRP